MKTLGLVCATVVVIFSLAGCANPLYKPSKSMSDTILTEYVDYVAKDAALDQGQKDRRVRAVNSYNSLLSTFDNSNNIGGK